MASAFPGSLMASGGMETPPNISGSAMGMTKKVEPDFGIYMEAQNPRKN